MPSATTISFVPFPLLVGPTDGDGFVASAGPFFSLADGFANGTALVHVTTGEADSPPPRANVKRNAQRAMADKDAALPYDVPGKFCVVDMCIGCDDCRSTAPGNIERNDDEYSFLR